MNQDSFSAQIIGIFLAETVKNVAKGSANILYNNFNLLFYSEITTLGLNESTDSEEIARQLEARPEMLETVQQKLHAHPDLVEEMKRFIQKESEKRQQNINTQTYNEKIEISSNYQSGGQTAQNITNITNNPLPPPPKIVLTPKISFQKDYIPGGIDEHYKWRIDLSNDGEVAVRDFRVDIKFPNIFLNQHTHYIIEVTSKRTEDYRLFRSTNETHHIPVLHPEDEHCVFLGDYTVSREMRENGELERKVFISVFSGDTLVCKIERKMSEFIGN